MRAPLSRRAVGLLAAVAFAACSPDGLTDPTLTPSMDLVPDPPALVYVCKAGLEHSVIGQSFDFTTTATGGTVALPQTTVVAQAPADIDTSTLGLVCHLVWSGPDPSPDVSVTVTELDAGGLDFVRVWDIAGFFGFGTFVDVFPTDGSVTFTADHGRVVIFHNGRDMGEGCTPGYWRQEHHYDSWVGFAPSDLFSDVFGVGPAVPLGEAVMTEGGGNGPGALMRHAVAALLNATSPDVDYALTPVEVVDLVQEAFASGEFEDAKDLLEGFNESGCELD